MVNTPATCFQSPDNKNNNKKQITKHHNKKTKYRYKITITKSSCITNHLIMKLKGDNTSKNNTNKLIKGSVTNEKIQPTNSTTVKTNNHKEQNNTVTPDRVRKETTTQRNKVGTSDNNRNKDTKYHPSSNINKANKNKSTDIVIINNDEYNNKQRMQKMVKIQNKVSINTDDKLNQDRRITKQANRQNIEKQGIASEDTEVTSRTQKDANEYKQNNKDIGSIEDSENTGDASTLKDNNFDYEPVIKQKERNSGNNNQNNTDDKVKDKAPKNEIKTSQPDLEEVNCTKKDTSKMQEETHQIEDQEEFTQSLNSEQQTTISEEEENVAEETVLKKSRIDSPAHNNLILDLVENDINKELEKTEYDNFLQDHFPDGDSITSKQTLRNHNMHKKL